MFYLLIYTTTNKQQHSLCYLHKFETFYWLWISLNTMTTNPKHTSSYFCILLSTLISWRMRSLYCVCVCDSILKLAFVWCFQINKKNEVFKLLIQMINLFKLVSYRIVSFIDFILKKSSRWSLQFSIAPFNVLSPHSAYKDSFN